MLLLHLSFGYVEWKCLANIENKVFSKDTKNTKKRATKNENIKNGEVW